MRIRSRCWGRTRCRVGWSIRALVPGAVRLEVVEEGSGAVVGALESRHAAGLFEGVLEGRPVWLGYSLRAHNDGGTVGGARPLPFSPGPGRDGRLSHRRGHASALVGASRRACDRACRRGGGPFRGLGAERGARLGGRRLQRLGRPAQPDAAARRGRRLGDLHPRARRGGGLQVRAARRRRYPAAVEGGPGRHRGELRPQNASVVRRVEDFTWNDAAWLARRGAAQAVGAPISILEVHLGSWARGEGNRFLTYDELALRLVPYAVDLGFTHLELLPVNEHPFDGSWGYQPIGLFAPTSRHGTPHDFARFVDRCHQAGLARAAGLGARAFPDRRARPRPLRRHGALRARGPAAGLPPGLEHPDLQFRPDRGRQLPACQRAVLARPLPCRRPPGRCGGLDALPRLLAPGRRVGAQPVRRAREPGSGRLHAPDERAGLRRASGRHDRGRGIHRLAAACRGRPGPAGWASATSGTWGGCTTPWNTWARTRPIAAGTTTR